MTTLPDPPRTGTIHQPPEGSGELDGSGDVKSSGDMDGEIVKIDEDNLGNQIPYEETSSGLSDDLIVNRTVETTEEDETSSGLVYYEIITTAGVEDTSGLPKEEVLTTKEIVKATVADHTEEVRFRLFIDLYLHYGLKLLFGIITSKCQ